MCGTIISSDDATVIRISSCRPDGTVPMMYPAIGVILILVGIVLFIIDLNVTNHGLLTAGGIVTLLAGGLVLFGAGVPYSGLLLGAVVVVAMIMGGTLLGVLGSLRLRVRTPALTGKEGMIGEVGTVRSLVGVNSEGWVFVHGELWRGMLWLPPQVNDPPRAEAVR